MMVAGRSEANHGRSTLTPIKTFPHSGRVRGVASEKMDHAHLVGAMHEVMSRLGGTARVWRPTLSPR